MIETQFSLPIKVLCTNCGGEFISTPFNQFCASKGIIHQLSCPHTPQQNGMVERKHRHLVQCALALLSQSKLPISFWSYAIATAAHLINKLPTPNLAHKSHWEIVYHTTPNLTHHRTFGCKCFPLLTPYTAHKIYPKTTPCVFLGYPVHSKGYYCLNPVTHRMYTSRHVLFNENVLPGLKHPTRSNPNSSSTAQLVDTWLTTLQSLHVCSHNPPDNVNPTHEPSLIPTGPLNQHTQSVPAVPVLEPMVLPNSLNHQNNFTIESAAPISDITIPDTSQSPGFLTQPPGLPNNHIPSQSGHQMQNRSKSGIFKPKVTFTAHVDYTNVEHTSYTQASKHT